MGYDNMTNSYLLEDLLELETNSREVYPTGSLMLNLGLDVEDPKTGEFGLPTGDIVEIFGWNSTGKTLLAETVARSCQNRNPKHKVLVISTERPHLDRLSMYMDPKRTYLWSLQRADSKPD